jgi:hypothetical protein
VCQDQRPLSEGTQVTGLANFGDLQNEIYLAGLSGVVPSLPMSFAELERRAELALPPGTWSYVAGAAGDRDLSVELFGTTSVHRSSWPRSE